MPTESGGETATEELTRLRTELARVRETIARSERNGSSFSIGGTAVTQVAYERAQGREKDLMRRIASIEARLEGRASGGRAQLYSR